MQCPGDGIRDWNAQSAQLKGNSASMKNVGDHLFSLHGKVVMATGGVSGIGFGFLRGCATMGATVIAIDRQNENADCVIDELVTVGARAARVVKADVAIEAELDDAFGAVLAEFGRIDCVFANAGIMGRVSSFCDMSTDEYRRLMRVNLDGAFFTLRAAARHMTARARSGDVGGSLVACGSLSMFRGLHGLEHYAAAKSALDGMIRSLAVELGPLGIRANMLVPGFIRTGITTDAEAAEKTAAHYASITPLRRAGTVADIEGPAAYLASDASAFQTGTMMIIDGGQVIQGA